MTNQRITEIGEFALIERLTKIIGAPNDERIIVGIGDDVAVVAAGGEALLLATVDAQVEGTHFRRDLITPMQLGHRALAVNLSDIAAMGGFPWGALISLTLPPDLSVAWVEDFYQGLTQLAEATGTSILGGNLSKGTIIVADVVLLGSVHPAHLLRRQGARPGDLVLVTGTLGDAAAGLHLLFHPEIEIDPASRTFLLDRLLTPTPRLAEGQCIAHSGYATAMLDISDGLSSDIGHLCTASGVGVRLEAARLPCSSALHHLATAIGKPDWSLALHGGESYELCFTLPAESAEAIIADVQAKTGTPVTIIGEIRPQAEGRMLVHPDGTIHPLHPRGWQHFRLE